MRFLPIFLVLVGLLVIMACEEEGGLGVAKTSPEAMIVETPTVQLPITTPTLGLPAFSAAECEYLDTLSQQVSQTGEAMGKLAPLLRQADLFSESWRLNMATQLVTIQLVADDAHALRSPSSLVALHNQWLIAMDLYVEMVDRMVKGIDELDVAEIGAANELMVRGTEAVNTAALLIEDFNASRSGVCP